MKKSDEKRLQTLYLELKDTKPKGWSVIWSKKPYTIREPKSGSYECEECSIVVRPPNRKLGKFNISDGVDSAFSAGYHDRKANIWLYWRRIQDQEDASVKLLKWMQTVAISVQEQRPGYVRTAMRKRSGLCPICLAKLDKTGKGTRYKHICHECLAILKPEIRCPFCNTSRVWVSRKEKRCKGCGKVVND